MDFEVARPKKPEGEIDLIGNPSSLHYRKKHPGPKPIAQRQRKKLLSEDDLAIQKKKTSKRRKELIGPRIWKREYVKIADDYAKRAVADKNNKTFGRWTRLAAQRYLNDRLRARQPNAPFYFDEWYAQDPCDFIEKLPHVEGSWDTANIVLHESDVFFIVNLFGFRSQNHTRRFSTALKAVARKNAKSTIAAGIGLYCLTCEDEMGPQVISAATTGSQARIIFNIAKAMVEKSPKVRKEYELDPYANSIANYKHMGSFKPINSKASTQDGLNPSCVLLDEIHAHKAHDLVNVLRSAAGARKNLLFLYTTTEGYETPGPWPELRHLAKQILEGVVQADHFLVVYYALDDAIGHPGEKGYRPPDDDFDESCWGKANPLIDVNPLLLEKIREEAEEAKSMPGRLAEFRIKRLNRAASSAGGWINLLQWKECGRDPIDLKKLEPFPCYGGLDLASTKDLTSFRLTWQLPDGHLWTFGWRFVPKAAVKHRNTRGLVPYKAWVDGGYLIEAGDEVTDYDAVEKCIIDAKKRFNIQEIRYDGWNAKQLSQKLIDQQIPMVEFIQGPKSYHPAMQALEHAYPEGKLHHGGDPVLTWCASNIIARKDINLNMAPDRKQAPDKIDDMAALLMSIPVLLETEKPPQHQAFFL